MLLISNQEVYALHCGANEVPRFHHFGHLIPPFPIFLITFAQFIPFSLVKNSHLPRRIIYILTGQIIRLNLLIIKHLNQFTILLLSKKIPEKTLFSLFTPPPREAPSSLPSIPKPGTVIRAFGSRFGSHAFPFEPCASTVLIIKFSVLYFLIDGFILL